MENRCCLGLALVLLYCAVTAEGGTCSDNSLAKYLGFESVTQDCDQVPGTKCVQYDGLKNNRCEPCPVGQYQDQRSDSTYDLSWNCFWERNREACTKGTLYTECKLCASGRYQDQTRQGGQEGTEWNSTEQSRAEESRAVQSRAEQSGTEQSKAEQSKAEQYMTSHRKIDGALHVIYET